MLIRKLSSFSLLSAMLVVTGNSFAAPIDDVIAKMAPGTWYELPNTKLDSVTPEPRAAGIEGPTGVIRSWSGGTYDTKRERLILWGGGHTAYGGNEIYTFELNANPPQWVRLNDPSYDVGGDPASGFYPDGKPRARHTHNYILYVPNIDKFMVFGGVAYYPTSYGGPGVLAFDFDTLTWDTSLPDIPYADYIASDWVGSNAGSNALYDPVTGSVWYQRANYGRLFRYDPINKRWSAHVARTTAIYGTAALDPERRLIVSVGCRYCESSGNKQIIVWDLDNPDAAPIVPETTGDDALESAQAPGFEYDPILKKFVGWDGGTAVYILDPDTWTWTKVDAAPANTVTPTASNPRGTYGRFRYVPSKNIYIVVNSIYENVYILKLTNGSGTASWPLVNISATPASVSVGESTRLSWLTDYATSCSASSSTGLWTGAKSISTGSVVSEIVGPITEDSSFTLTCVGTTGSVSATVDVNVAVASGGSSGSSGSGTELLTSTEGGAGSVAWLTFLVLLMSIVIARPVLIRQIKDTQ